MRRPHGAAARALTDAPSRELVTALAGLAMLLFAFQPLFEKGTLYGDSLFREGVVEAATVMCIGVVILSVFSALGGRSEAWRERRKARRGRRVSPSGSRLNPDVVDVPVGVSWALKRTVTPVKSDVKRAKEPRSLSWRMQRKH